MLLDLAEENVVERTLEGEWDLSFRLLAITGQQLGRIGIPGLARPFVERIAERTGETVNVYARSGDRAVCLDKVRGNQGMQLDMPIGHRGGLTNGGSGKAILAYMGQEERERAMSAEPLTALTAQTITDRMELEAELGRIRQRGYSIDDQEVVTGVYCVSMPLLDRLAQPMGAISISGPSVKVPGPTVSPLVEMLNEACQHVSRRLGYAGPWPRVELAERPDAALEGSSCAKPG
jgi:IclR family acetate operon transcriptional repressor